MQALGDKSGGGGGGGGSKQGGTGRGKREAGGGEGGGKSRQCVDGTFSRFWLCFSGIITNTTCRSGIDLISSRQFAGPTSSGFLKTEHGRARSRQITKTIT